MLGPETINSVPAISSSTLHESTHLKGRVPPQVHQNDIIASSQIESYDQAIRVIKTQDAGHLPVLPALKEIKITRTSESFLIFANAASRSTGFIDPSSRTVPSICQTPQAIRRDRVRPTSCETNPLLTEEGHNQIKHRGELRKDNSLLVAVRPLVDILQQLQNHSDLGRGWAFEFLALGCLSEGNARHTVSIPSPLSGITGVESFPVI